LSRSGLILYSLRELKLSRSRIVPAFASILVLLGLATARILDLGLLERFEAVSYDVRVRAAETTGAPCATNLGFIFIDEVTISAVKNGLLQAPYGLHWPRHVYGLIVEQVVREGARTVAFDVLFGELRVDHGGIVRDGKIFESDEFLAEQMKVAGNVLLAFEPGLIPPDLFRTNAAALGDITTDKDSDGVLRRVRAFRDYRLWHSAFRDVESDPDFGVDLSKAKVEDGMLVLPRYEVDDIMIPLDEDGRFSLADFYGEHLPAGTPPRAFPYHMQRVWHMGVVLAAQELGLDLENAEVELERGRIVLKGPSVQRVIPVDDQGRFFIEWSIPVSDPRVFSEPAVNLLERNMDVRQRSVERGEGGDHWAGKLVVIGSTATGNDLRDMGATPVQRDTFLVSKHWNVANSIIVDRFIRRGTPFQEVILVLLAGLAAGLFALWLRPLLGFVFTLGGVSAYILLAFGLYSSDRIWLPLIIPATASVSVYLVIATWRIVFEQSERRRVKSVFSKVVSPNVVAELLHAKELALGGARGEITVLFADVRGFTSLTDQAHQSVLHEVQRLGLTGQDAKALHDQQAKKTLNTVNLYLSLVADVVKKHKGTLDKYIGDCVMAFWGAPTRNSQHALYCVRAAIDAQRSIARANVERAQANNAGGEELPLLTLGTGINTGEATVGLMGSDDHILSYTVFGREVNVASRLEGVSGRGRIIISETTYQHIQRDDARLAASCVSLEPVSVKGIREQVKIYEVPWRIQEQEGTQGDRRPEPTAR